MTTAEAALAKQVMKWPPSRRIEFAEDLLASVEGFATPEIAAAWDKELESRTQEIRAGRAEGIPAATAMAQARRKLQATRRLSSPRRPGTR